MTLELRKGFKYLFWFAETHKWKLEFSRTEGKIFTKVGLDHGKKRSQHTFTVMLEERKPSTKVWRYWMLMTKYQRSSTLTRGTINENAPSGTPVTVEPPISAVDNDSGNNSVVRYSLSGAGSELFKILESGQVIFNSPDPILTLDRERKERYDLQVTATDMGNLSSSTYLTINIADENDNAPVFPARAPEGDAAGDRPAGIQNCRGEIYVVSTLRPGTVYLLNVSAADGKGLAASTVVNITVVDVNDHKPTFSRYEYTFRGEGGQLQPRQEVAGVLKLSTRTPATTEWSKFPFTVDSKTGNYLLRELSTENRRVLSITKYSQPILENHNSTQQLTSLWK
ncbi:protocadherin Fat 4 [Caerostris extrusa]|uniref:Protocadherin Fat 4 n=1 Tax=Caerostris extrusa TaxID=172846 RepID=A0AAV4R0Y3_CAEEX|nr:protocadherin Fat 4 [Caerostris extrusa]